jgi:hypothetical protein
MNYKLQTVSSPRLRRLKGAAETGHLVKGNQISAAPEKTTRLKFEHQEERQHFPLFSVMRRCRLHRHLYDVCEHNAHDLLVQWQVHRMWQCSLRGWEAALHRTARQGGFALAFRPNRANTTLQARLAPLSER